MIKKFFGVGRLERKIECCRFSWYIIINKSQKGNVVCGNNFPGEESCGEPCSRVLSHLRMYEKMGTLDDIDVEKIKNGFLRLYS